MSEEVVLQPSEPIYRWCLTSTERRAPTTGALGETSNEREDGYFKGNFLTNEEINGLFHNHGEWINFLNYEKTRLDGEIDAIEASLSNVSQNYTNLTEEDYNSDVSGYDPEMLLEMKLRRRQSDLKESIDSSVDLKITNLESVTSPPGLIAGLEIDLNELGAGSTTPGAVTMHKYGATSWAGVNKMDNNVPIKTFAILNSGRTDWYVSDFVQVGSTPCEDGTLVHIFYCEWRDNVYIDTDRRGVHVNDAYIAAYAISNPGETAPAMNIRRIGSTIIKKRSKDGIADPGLYTVAFVQRGDEFQIKRRAPYIDVTGYIDDNETDYYLHSGVITSEETVEVTLDAMYCPNITNGLYNILISFAESDSGTNDSSLLVSDTVSQYRLVATESSKFGIEFERLFSAINNKISVRNISVGGTPNVEILRVAVGSWIDQRGKDGNI